MPQRHTMSVMLPPHGGEGLLGLPPDPQGIVLFAHRSFSSRLSRRNTVVAEVLQQAGQAMPSPRSGRRHR